MINDIGIEITGRSFKHNCNSSFRLTPGSENDPDYLAEIVKCIQSQMDSYIKLRIKHGDITASD